MRAVLADAQEDDAVDGALDGKVEFALRELGIAHGEIAREIRAPLFDFVEKCVVDFGRAALAPWSIRRTCRTSL